MLEMRKMVVSLEEADLMELEGIIMEGDENEALRYLKKTVKDAPARAVLALAERYLRRDESGAVLQMVTGEGDAPSSGGRCC